VTGYDDFLGQLLATHAPVDHPLCQWCTEEIEGECDRVSQPCARLGSAGQVEAFIGYYHRACYLRMGVGSVAHQQAIARGETDCQGHVHSEDPEFGTVREYALAAADYYLRSAPRPDLNG